MADCFARFYCPLNNDLTANTNDTGHVDLEISGTFYNLDSHINSITNPVFSYGGYNGVGYVRVFPNNKTTANLTNKYLLCKYKFTASSALVNATISTIYDYMSFVEQTSDYTLYVMNSTHPYYNYSINRYNCYGATAYWCNLLGFSGLWDTYNTYTDDYEGYKNYVCWKTLEDKYQYLSYNMLHTT